MKNKYDLYISFPLNTENKDALIWINNFKSFLAILLEKIFKREINIVLSGEKISKEALKDSAAYLLLFNSEYENKEFQKEIKEIIQTAKENFNLRIFKVFTTKINYNDYSEFLNPLINYNFYTIDIESGKTIEFSELKGEKDEKLFWLKLVDLAYDIYSNLLKLDKNVEAVASQKQKFIYLAETGEDQYENRDIIKRELLQHGYKVFPEKHIGLENKTFNEEVKNYLKKSCMSIHVIGEDYSQSQDEEHSICAIQNSLASKYFTELENANKVDDLKRIIWISPELNLKTEKQKNQIEQLKQDEDALKGAEVIQTPIELLKTVIHNRLNDEHGADKKSRIHSNEKKKDKNILSVYLVYDELDKENIKSVRDYFVKHNFEIIDPLFEGDEYELIREHKNRLVRSDMVFVYHNNNNEWLISKIKDIIKSPGFGRTRPFISKVIYYNENQKITVDDFTKENFLIMKGKVDFDAKILDPLFKKAK